MALPSKKRPKSEKRKRKASFALKKLILTSCPKCGKGILPYHACPSCGTYASKEVLKFEIKGKKKK